MAMGVYVLMFEYVCVIIVYLVRVDTFAEEGTVLSFRLRALTSGSLALPALQLFDQRGVQVHKFERRAV